MRMRRRKENEGGNETIRHEIYHPSQLRAFRWLPVKSLSVSALGLPPPEPSTFNVQLSTFFELFDLETGFVHLETSFVALYRVKGRPARFMKSRLGGLAAPKSDEGRNTM